MKRAQDGFAGNFGLVGKGMRRYLATTALTATSILATASPASADNWTDHVASKGSISIDTSKPNTTNITQHTDFVKVSGDGDINAGWTVNIAQPSNSSKYVFYDIENDPTMIMGALNAPGQVYIFDKNGVIFGEGSQVNVGSIITSTGFISDDNIKANKIVFEGVSSTDGQIAINGSISVSDAGLAAFVAPTVVNNGVISAKLGKVVMASGEKVTLDFYGDDLVNVAVKGDLKNALIKNNGAIKAEGGSVYMTAATAKEAVDNVINMDGVIDVSSVSVKGGKIILSGGNNGSVKVSGALKANGKTGGGDVKVTGKNVVLDTTSEIAADATVVGNGGRVYIYGSDKAVMGGTASVRGGALAGNGGFVELSAMDSVGFNGLVDASAANGETGTFLIDPTTINLGNFAAWDVGTLANLKIDAQALANTLRLANTHLWATDRIFTSDNIDLSRWAAFGFSGISNKNLTLSADTIDILHDVTLGTGKLIIDDALTTDSVFGFGLVKPTSDILVQEVNLNGKIYTRSSTAQAAFTTKAGDAQIDSNANIVNVLSNRASIQQGVWFANDAGGATVNAAAGRYYESILINKGLTLNGANKDIGLDDPARGLETWIDKDPANPMTPDAITITASNVTINGLLAQQFKRGITAENVSNIDIRYNRLTTAHDQLIYMDGVTNLTVLGNKLDAAGSGDAAIYVANSSGDVAIDGNIIGTRRGTNGDGIYVYNTDDANIRNNFIRIVDPVWNSTSWGNPVGVGIRVVGSDGARITDNLVKNTRREGIVVDGGSDAKVLRNVVGYEDMSATADAGAANIGGHGIALYGVDGATVKGNKITNTQSIDLARGDGIHIQGGNDIKVRKNIIDNTHLNGIFSDGTHNILVKKNKIGQKDGSTIGGNGIDVLNPSGEIDIIRNKIAKTALNGIKVGGSDGDHVFDHIDVLDNTVDLAGYDGIHVHYFNSALIQGNTVSRSGDDGIEAHDGADIEIDGNKISESGIGTIVEEEGPVSYDGYDEFEGGHDGISVRRIRAASIASKIESEEYSSDYYYGYPGNVRITNNKVTETGGGETQYQRIVSRTDGGISISGDDGIEVVDVDGYVYIYNNSVENSGTDGIGNYGDADIYGADGIHVRNVFSTGYIPYVARAGDVGNGEYNIVVAGNTVNNSLDDGIEIVGSYYGVTAGKASASVNAYPDYFGYGPTERVLVKDNTVSNSGWGNPADGFGQSIIGFGGDGIRVQGIFPNGSYSAGVSETGEYAGYAVDILHNTVTNSGDDGIEVVNASSTLIDENTVKNSGLVVVSEGDGEGEGSEGFNTADWFGADGIFVYNVGYQYSNNNDKRVSTYAVEAEGPSGDYTPYSVVIRRNDVDASKDDGIQVHNDMWMGETAPVLVDINKNVSNSGSHGLYISGPSHSNVIVSGNSFSNFNTGAEFESGLINLTGAGNSFTNGVIGLRFAPYIFEGEGAPSFANLDLVDVDGFGSTPYPATPVNFGGTIGQQVFTGFTQPGKFYVYLADGAFTNGATPVWINGLNSTYDGLRPSTTGGVLTQAQFNYLEARFHHFPDAGNRDIFWFGYVPETNTVNQNLIFNRFNAFNGDTTGLNVQIRGLPTIPGGGAGPAALNNITTFAGGNNPNAPTSLNQIETAAGGEGGTSTQALNNIETSAGEEQSCWTNAVNAAGEGQTVNVTYNGSFADNLNQAAACGGTF